MNGLETASVGQKSVVAYFTCVMCGTVDEISVPREEGLPPKIYWQCPTCQMQVDGDHRIASLRRNGECRKFTGN